MTAQQVVDSLLETGVTPIDPGIASAHRRIHRQRREMPWAYPAPVDNTLYWLLHAVDASGRSFEGEPDEKQRAREQAIARERKVGYEGGYPRKSHAIASSRNARRKSFGYKDVYSTKDRNWPMPNRKSYYKTQDRAMKLVRAKLDQDQEEGSGI